MESVPYGCIKMPADILSQINWIDIFVVIILFRICYIAARTGLPVEIFKFAGIILSVYLALHYYLLLGGFIYEKSGLKNISADLLNSLAFLVLAISGYLVFILLRIVFYRFIKMDATPQLHRWGGFVLGVMRGFILASIILFLFIISPGSYFRESVNKSYSGKSLVNISPTVYSMLWNGVISKFRPQEEFNGALFEPLKYLEQKQENRPRQ